MARKRRVPRSSVPTGRERWIARVPGQDDLIVNESVGAGRRPIALLKAQERVMRFEPRDADVLADVLVKYEHGEPEVIYRVERHDGIVVTSIISFMD